VNDIALTNAAEFTVTELSTALKRRIEDEFGHVRVRGEISGYRGPHSSGHAYFSLKDQGAKIDAVIWKGVFSRLKIRPEEGMEVVATGKLTTFPGSSKYQIVIESLELAGLGALMALLEARRKKLAAEGLFDEARKQLLPYMPQVIGVITSPTGAVIRDILHRIADRMPCHVLIWPVRVQGETCGAEVSAAILGLNALAADGPIPRPDVIIVARGGGSLEDLNGFNDEQVVRAAAASDIPLISAVGHETDWTLIDYAADVRAPTPTAAAELAVPVRSDLIASVKDLNARLFGAVIRAQQRRNQDLRALVRALPQADTVLASPRQKLDMLNVLMKSGIAKTLDRRRIVLARLSPSLAAKSPHAQLATQKGRLTNLEQRLPRALQQNMMQKQQKLITLADKLQGAFGKIIALAGARQQSDAKTLATLSARLAPAFAAQLRRRHEQLINLDKLRLSLGYKQVLARGFALVRDANGTPVRSADMAQRLTRLTLEFSDGKVSALPEHGPRSKKSAEPQKPDSPPKSTGPQGSLF